MRLALPGIPVPVHPSPPRGVASDGNRPGAWMEEAGAGGTRQFASSSVMEGQHREGCLMRAFMSHQLFGLSNTFITSEVVLGGVGRGLVCRRSAGCVAFPSPVPV